MYAIVGGSAVFFGPMLGAALITALPELLRNLKAVGIEPGAATVFANGLVLLLVILFLPNGLTGLSRPRRPRPPSGPTTREAADEPVAAR